MPEPNPDCKYWRECKTNRNIGHCNLNFYGGNPPKSVCRVCISRGNNRPKGLGDEVARIAQPIKRAIRKIAPNAMKKCGCSERQNKLNEMFPKKDKEDG